jgi:hypothetical protein
LYSLTGSLTSEVTAAPTTSGVPTSPASVAITSTTSSSVGTTSVKVLPIPTYSQVGNGTLTTSSSLVFFTGAAGHLMAGAVPAIVLTGTVLIF